MIDQVENLVPDEHRRQNLGEVLTSSRIVKQMCDLVEPDVSDPFKSCLEPTAGTGNFVVEVVRRKLQRATDRTSRLASFANMYAIDIGEQNRQTIIIRLREIADELLPADEREHAYEIIDGNVILGDFMTGLNPITGEPIRFINWFTGNTHSFRQVVLGETDLLDFFE